MNGYVKIYGKTRQSLKDNWQRVLCFVTYSDDSAHQKIVEDSFQYHLGLDLSYMKQNHPYHFTDPGNVGRAILLYHYFRERHQFFEDDRCEYIGPAALPKRDPDAADDNYRLWVSEDNEI